MRMTTEWGWAPYQLSVRDKVTDLNKELKEYKGFVEKNLDLSKSLVKLSEGEKMVHRDYRHTKKPCPVTVQFYQILSTECDDSIHLIYDKNLKPKDNHRQMASMLVHNLASHIATIWYANIIPCDSKWHGPKDLLQGCYTPSIWSRRWLDPIQTYFTCLFA